jgi:hypothetical protein
LRFDERLGIALGILTQFAELSIRSRSSSRRPATHRRPVDGGVILVASPS